MEHAQSLPRRLGHGRFDLGQILTRSPPLLWTELVWLRRSSLIFRVHLTTSQQWPE